MRVIRWLRDRAKDVGVVLLAAMFFTFILQVFMRYVVGNPLGWTLEASLIVYLWLIFWFCGFLIKDEEQVYFDVIYAAVRPKTRRIFDIVTGTIIVLALAISYPATVDYVTFMKVEKTGATQIRLDYVFSIFIIFMPFIIIRGGIRLFHLISRDAKAKDKIEEGKS
jgi:TRAP-type C4-dicarboxylate transport system permease small subunit